MTLQVGFSMPTRSSKCRVHVPVDVEVVFEVLACTYGRG